MRLKQRLEQYFLDLEFDLYDLGCYGVRDIIAHSRVGKILMQRYNYTHDDFDSLRAQQ